MCRLTSVDVSADLHTLPNGRRLDSHKQHRHAFIRGERGVAGELEHRSAYARRRRGSASRNNSKKHVVGKISALFSLSLRLVAGFVCRVCVCVCVVCVFWLAVCLCLHVCVYMPVSVCVRVSVCMSVGKVGVAVLAERSWGAPAQYGVACVF